MYAMSIVRRGVVDGRARALAMVAPPSHRTMATLGSSASNVKYVRVGGYDIPKRLVARWKRKQRTLQAHSLLFGDTQSAAAAHASAAPLALRPVSEMPCATAEQLLGAVTNDGTGPAGVHGQFLACQLRYRLNGNVPGSWLLALLTHTPPANGPALSMADWYVFVRGWQFFESRGLPFVGPACSDALVSAGLRCDAQNALVALLRGAPRSQFHRALRPTAAGWLALLRSASSEQVPAVWAAMQACHFQPTPKCYKEALHRLRAASPDAVAATDTGDGEARPEPAGKHPLAVQLEAQLAAMQRTSTH